LSREGGTGLQLVCARGVRVGEGCEGMGSEEREEREELGVGWVIIRGNSEVLT
jgi:hypothetical protein